MFMEANIKCWMVGTCVRVGGGGLGQVIAAHYSIDLNILIAGAAAWTVRSLMNCIRLFFFLSYSRINSTTTKDLLSGGDDWAKKKLG